jgi:transposase InsO family protein
LPIADHSRASLNGEQRLLVLDAWARSGLPAGDFAPLVGVSRNTLYGWKRRFEALGPAGLMDRSPGPASGSRMPEPTKRAILMMKQAHPDWGTERISGMLARGPGLGASAGAVSNVLKEAGYESVEETTRPHEDKIRRFERATPNQLWQTDLFTFVLKRQNQRVYLVVFMDDHSRYVVSYGLHASQSTELALETLRAGIASYGTPKEVLTDNGTQYVTWRGKSRFTQECEKRGITQIVSRPQHPETLGKTERFWGTLWRELLETAVFADMGDARIRIGLFIDYYNFRRVHSGIDGAVPADRFFRAAAEVKSALASRVAENALEMARGGMPKAPFYLTGNVGGQPFSLHAEGERVVVVRDGQRAEVALDPRPPTPPLPDPLAPAPAAPQPPPAPVMVSPTAPIPPVAPAVLPMPVAAGVVVTSGLAGPSPDQLPGTSALDALGARAAVGGAP